MEKGEVLCTENCAECQGANLEWGADWSLAGAQVVLTYRQGADKARVVSNNLAGGGHLAAQASEVDSRAMKQFATKVAEQYGAGA